MNKETVWAFNPDMICRKIGDQTIVVPVGQQVDDVRSIYTFNDTAAFILDGIRANKNREQVILDLKEEYDIENDTDLIGSVDGIITELKELRILL